MDKEFVPYEIALELKELGFDEPCLFWYNLSDNNKLATNAQFDSYNPITYTNTTIPKKSSYGKELESITAPLYQQAFRWFRKKGYDVKVQKEFDGLYFGFYWTGAAWIIVGNGSYEEAELECLKKLIEIAKEKNK